MVQKRQKAKLIGVGLDGKEEEEFRVTRSEDFHIVGGSKDTHEQMQEKCIKFTEKVQSRGKELADLESKEFLDIAAQCEMNVLKIKRDK